jgi:hypothetical protein
MEYKFSGKLSFDDFVQMNRFYMAKIFFKKLSYLFIFCIIISSGFFIYRLIFYNTIRFMEDILPLLFFGIIILFVIKQPKILYKKHFEKDKISQEEQTFIINENEISIASDNSFIKFTKDKINKIKYDNDSIYLFISENKICVIKSRYLGNLTEFNELKDFLKSNYINKE